MTEQADEASAPAISPSATSAPAAARETPSDAAVAPAGAFTLELAGSTLQLLPDRAVAWPARRTLIVADIHFGKDDVFRRAGLALPDGAAAEDLERLGQLVAATRSERLLVLGDFVHGAVEADDAFPRHFAAWRRRHAALTIEVIAGNHDRHLGRAPQAWLSSVTWHAGVLRDGPLEFAHAPRAAPGEVREPLATPRLAGHLHPVTRLAVPGGTALRVPVFWQRAEELVLPAFGRLTGGQRVAPLAGERLIVAGPARAWALPRAR